MMLTSPVVFFRTVTPGYRHAVLPVAAMCGLSVSYSYVSMSRALCNAPLWLFAVACVSDVAFFLFLVGVLSCSALVAARVAGAREYSRRRLVLCLACTYWISVPPLAVAVLVSFLSGAGRGECVEAEGLLQVVDAMEAWGDPAMRPGYWPAITAMVSYCWLLTLGWQVTAFHVVTRCSVRASVSYGLFLALMYGAWWLATL